MDFSKTDEQLLMIENVREVMKRGDYDLYFKECDEKSEFPEKAAQDMVDAGFAALYIPEEYGGTPCDLLTLVYVMEEAHAMGWPSMTWPSHPLQVDTMLTYGTEAQKKTFLTSNVAPQRPSLNRGPWREIEHRIADLWTAKYGEIWVVVGCVPGDEEDRLPSGVDAPKAFWQVIAAQTADGVRALAVYMPKNIPYSAFPVHNIVTIDELERLTGLDFFPDMPKFLQNPLEADLPTRLWPVRFVDMLKLILLRFGGR